MEGFCNSTTSARAPTAEKAQICPDDIESSNVSFSGPNFMNKIFGKWLQHEEEWAMPTDELKEGI